MKPPKVHMRCAPQKMCTGEAKGGGCERVDGAVGRETGWVWGVPESCRMLLVRGRPRRDSNKTIAAVQVGRPLAGSTEQCFPGSMHACSACAGAQRAKARLGRRVALATTTRM